MRENKSELIDPYDYTKVVKQLRSFFDSKDFQEVHTQNRLSILAACEDPETVATFKYMGKKWPLPQTGQMWLEYELLTRPELKGCYCLSTSYRQEPNPIAGRHQLIFPMFEFEAPGNFNDLLVLEKELLEHLGFNYRKDDYLYGHDNEYHTAHYMGMVEKYHAEDAELTAEHELKIYDDFGDVFFLTHFPEHTSPFWNMKMEKMEYKAGSMVSTKYRQRVALKCDVIIGGMETIGSAERSSDVQEMKHQFNTISDGNYRELLYGLFSPARVDLEFFEFLTHNFVPRFGGGIGIQRLIRGMKIAKLLTK